MSDKIARKPQGVAGLILPQLILCIFLFVAYGALDGSFDLTSLISSAILAPALMLFSLRLVAARPDRIVLRVAWLAQIPRVLWSVVVESVRVGTRLVDAILGRDVRGVLRELPFTPRGDGEDEQRTHRALAEIAGSASPNGVIMSVTPDGASSRMSVHQLRTAPLRPDWPI